MTATLGPSVDPPEQGYFFKAFHVFFAGYESDLIIFRIPLFYRLGSVYHFNNTLFG